MRKLKLMILNLILKCLSGHFGPSKGKVKASLDNVRQNYVAVKEGELFYQTFGHGKPVIVLHGGPGMDQNYLLPQMLELANKYQVIFYDQRGSGKSLDTKIDTNTINVSRFVEDLETLRRRLGYEKIILVGHSWGGLLAMHYAIQHQEHLHALVLLNSMPATSKGTQAFVQEYNKITSSVKKQIEEIYNSYEFTQGEPKFVENFYRLVFTKYLAKEEDIQKLSLRSSQRSAQGGFKKINDIFFQNELTKPYDLRNYLNKLNIPTLIVHTDKDPIPLWTAQEIYSSIPHSKFIVIKDCGHFPYAEKPDELFSGMYRFLHGIR